MGYTPGAPHSAKWDGVSETVAGEWDIKSQLDRDFSEWKRD